ncbi:N-acetyl sugar amidotransferase, partial [Pseudomonas aeruginosa]
EQRLQKIIGQIKKDGSGKDYDCIIGLSGGVDSSYLAVKVKDLGLRPLVVH